MKKVVMITALLLFAAVATAYAGPQGKGKMAHRSCDPVMAQLAPDQRQEVRDEVRALHQSGASAEDVTTAVKAKLASFGVETPEGWTFQPQHNRPPQMRGLQSQLTDTQQQILDNKVAQLRAENATREEVRVAVDELLDNWGVERPAGCRQQPAENPFGDDPAGG